MHRVGVSSPRPTLRAQTSPICLPRNSSVQQWPVLNLRVDAVTVLSGGLGEPSPGPALIQFTFVHYLIAMSADDATRFRKQAEEAKE